MLCQECKSLVITFAFYLLKNLIFIQKLISSRILNFCVPGIESLVISFAFYSLKNLIFIEKLTYSRILNFCLIAFDFVYAGIEAKWSSDSLQQKQKSCTNCRCSCTEVSNESFQIVVIKIKQKPLARLEGCYDRFLEPIK